MPPLILLIGLLIPIAGSSVAPVGARATPIEDYLERTTPRSFNLPRPEGSDDTELGRHLTAADRLLAAGDVVRTVIEIEGAARQAPRDATLAVALAELYLRVGVPTLAINAAKAALVLVPAAAQPHDIIGTAERALGHFDKADEQFRLVIEKAPDQALGYLHLGQVRYARRDFAGALTVLELALARAPDSRPALLLAADCLLQLKRPSEAEERVDAALKNDPHDALALLLRADARLAAGRAEAAETDYRDAAASAASFTPFGLRLAEFLRGQGRLRESIDAYNAVLRHDTRSGAARGALAELYAQTGDTALAAVQRGYLALQTADPDAATRAFEEATAADPAIEPAWVGRAVVALQRRAYDAADAMLAKALALAPDDPVARTLAGEVAEARGNRRAAERDYRSVIAANGRHIPALTDLANLLKLDGNCAEAIPLFRAVAELAPDQGEPHRLIADCYQALARPEEAVVAYRIAIARSPDNAPALNSLAWLYLQTRRHLADALFLAKKASLLQPGDPGIIDTLGWAYVLNGQPDLAVPNLEMALSGLPGEPAIHYHLGMALAALDQKTRAIIELEQALATGASFPEASAARSLLDRLSRQ